MDVSTKMFLAGNVTIAVASLIGVFSNFLTGLPISLSIFTLVLFLINSAFFFNVRKLQVLSNAKAILFLIILLSFLMFFWPQNGGYNGPILMYFFVIPMFTGFFFNRKKSYGVFFLIILLTTLFLVYYFVHPELIFAYSSEKLRLLDTVISLVLSGGVSLEMALYYKEQQTRQQEELVKKNELIVLQMKAIQEIDEYKSIVFASMSHDLKGPINNVKSIFELINDDTLSLEEKTQVFNSTQDQIKESSALVENILFWARSQMKGLNINKETFLVNELIQNVTSSESSSLLKKRIYLQTHIPGHIYAIGDKELFKIVLSNIIRNAVKFSKEQSIITIFVGRNSKKEIFVQVKDEGMGIPESQLPFIFDGGLSSVGTKKEIGSGLGLKLCKLFTELNGGLITVESKVNEGSFFTFTIPEGAKSMMKP